MKNIYLISGNEGKLREFRSIIPQVKNIRLELDEIQSLDPIKIIEHKLNNAKNKLNNEGINLFMRTM